MVDGGPSAKLDDAGTAEHQRSCQRLDCSTVNGQGASVEVDELCDGTASGDIDVQRGSGVDAGHVRPTVGCRHKASAKRGVVGNFKCSSTNGHPALESIGSAQGGGARTELLKVAKP